MSTETKTLTDSAFAEWHAETVLDCLENYAFTPQGKTLFIAACGELPQADPWDIAAMIWEITRPRTDWNDPTAPEDFLMTLEWLVSLAKEARPKASLLELNEWCETAIRAALACDEWEWAHGQREEAKSWL